MVLKRKKSTPYCNKKTAARTEIVYLQSSRHIGVGDWKLLQSAMSNPLVTNQIEISLSEVSPFTNGDLAFHQMQGDAVMAWSPLGGGSLMTGSGELASRLDEVATAQGVDRAAVAVAFLLRHPAKILPVMGSNNLARIATISDAQKVELDRQTWFRLYEAALGREVA